MRNNFYDCLYPLWAEEMNLKDFLHPAVIRISPINHGSLTVASDHVLIIASQRIAKCDLSKSIKKTYIWCCWWCKPSTFQLCVVKRSIILNKTVIKSLLLGRQNRKQQEWGIGGDYLPYVINVRAASPPQRIHPATQPLCSGWEGSDIIAWIMADPKGGFQSKTKPLMSDHTSWDVRPT